MGCKDIGIRKSEFLYIHCYCNKTLLFCGIERRDYINFIYFDVEIYQIVGPENRFIKYTAQLLCLLFKCHEHNLSPKSSSFSKVFLVRLYCIYLEKVVFTMIWELLLKTCSPVSRIFDYEDDIFIFSRNVRKSSARCENKF